MATRTTEGRILLTEYELTRFYSHCVVDLETGCWDWTGGSATTAGDYGIFTVKIDGEWKTPQAHLVAYNHFVGAVPKGYELGHVRQRDRCAFWEHVRPITHTENMQELYGTKDRCPQGHLRALAGKTARGTCKVCARIAQAKCRGRIVCQCCGYQPCRAQVTSEA